MYELTIYAVDRAVKTLAGESVQMLLTEAASHFSFHGDDAPGLPFQAEVNSRGKIVLLTLEYDPTAQWWQQVRPRISGGDTPLRFVIRHKPGAPAAAGIAVPKKLYQERAKVWAAVHDGMVVDLVHKTACPPKMKREQFRDAARQALEQKGTFLSGTLRDGMFFPKLTEGAASAAG